MLELPRELWTRDPRERAIAAMSLVDILYFPNNPKEREWAAATRTAEALGKPPLMPIEAFLRGAEEHGDAFPAICAEALRSDPTLLAEWLRRAGETLQTRLFPAAGGFTAVAEAPGVQALDDKISTAQPKMLFAGWVLILLRSIDQHHATLVRGGGSLKKVWWLLQRWRPNAIPTIPSAVSTMRSHWDEYKSISHIIAALMQFRMDVPLNEKEIFAIIMEHTTEFYRYATLWQREILNRNLVAENIFWRLPDIGAACSAPSSAASRNHSAQAPSLPPEAQKVLAAYKAAGHYDIM